MRIVETIIKSIVHQFCHKYIYKTDINPFGYILLAMPAYTFNRDPYTPDIFFILAEDLADFIDSPRCQAFLLNCVFVYSQIIHYISRQFSHLCKNNQSINGFACTVQRTYKALNGLFTSQLKEPENNAWLCESYLFLRNSDEFSYDEVYNYDTVSFDDRLRKFDDFLTLSPSIVEGLLIAKSDDKYKYAVIQRKLNSALTNDFEPCTFKFLSISYNHDSMDEPIHINLDKSSYMEGNEILSPAFILRCLKYQPEKFVFDLNYSVDVMDHNISMFSLKSHQFVRLNKMGYSIIE